MGQTKHGIVYIADWPWPEDSPDKNHALDGHWETGDPDRPVEQGPGWDNPEEAIEWGRHRAPQVFIRIGAKTYSAGDEDPDDEAVLRWESRPT
jgi:hypothetical protein